MSIENESQIPEAEQIKKPDSIREGMPEEMKQKMDRVDRALSLGAGMIKRWLKDKKGVEFSTEQEEEFNKIYQASFAFSSWVM